MFESLAEAIRWVKQNYPGCSFSVKEQKDGPTIISIAGKGKELRTVVYVLQTEKEVGEKGG